MKMKTECDLNCQSIDAIRDNHEIDHFVTMVLGGCLGKLVDHGVTRKEILFLTDELLSVIDVATESAVTQQAFAAFADSIRITDLDG